MRVGAGRVPEISHAIPSCVLQTWKSERWNFAVFEVALCVAVGELHAELMGLPGLRCCVLGCCVLGCCVLGCCVPGCRAQCLAYCAARAVRGCPAAPSPPRVSHLLCREPRASALLRERRGYSACPASRSAARAAFLARACASTSSRVRGPCVVPLLPSVRSHEMVRLSRAPKRAR